MKVIEKETERPMFQVGNIDIKYKGWLIESHVDYENVEGKTISLIIYNKKIGIAHKIERSCHTIESYWEENEGSLLFPKMVKKHRTDYDQFKTINEFIEEAKQIVDCYELMKKEILNKLKIIEILKKRFSFDIQYDESLNEYYICVWNKKLKEWQKYEKIARCEITKKEYELLKEVIKDDK